MFLDRYKYKVDFLRDLSVTSDDLVGLLQQRPYISKIARYVARHPNCTETVLDIMTQSDLWFVRYVGYFHNKRQQPLLDKALNDSALQIRRIAARMMEYLRDDSPREE